MARIEPINVQVNVRMPINVVGRLLLAKERNSNAAKDPDLQQLLSDAALMICELASAGIVLTHEAPQDLDLEKLKEAVDAYQRAGPHPIRTNSSVEQTISLTGYNNLARGTTETIDALNERIECLNGNVAKLADELHETRTDRDRIKENQNELEEKLDALRKGSKGKIDELVEERDNLRKLLHETRVDPEKFKEEIDKYQKGLQEYLRNAKFRGIFTNVQDQVGERKPAPEILGADAINVPKEAIEQLVEKLRGLLRLAGYAAIVVQGDLEGSRKSDVLETLRSVQDGIKGLTIYVGLSRLDRITPLKETVEKTFIGQKTDIRYGGGEILHASVLDEKCPKSPGGDLPPVHVYNEKGDCIHCGHHESCTPTTQPEETLAAEKSRLEKELDACFCDDGRGDPECEACDRRRDRLGEIKAIEFKEHGKNFTIKVDRVGRQATEEQRGEEEVIPRAQNAHED